MLLQVQEKGIQFGDYNPLLYFCFIYTVYNRKKRKWDVPDANAVVAGMAAAGVMPEIPSDNNKDSVSLAATAAARINALLEAKGIKKVGNIKIIL